jgi:hypothetical protein
MDFSWWKFMFQCSEGGEYFFSGTLTASGDRRGLTGSVFTGRPSSEETEKGILLAFD